MDGGSEAMPACASVIVMHGWRSWEHGLGLPVPGFSLRILGSSPLSA